MSAAHRRLGFVAPLFLAAFTPIASCDRPLSTTPPPRATALPLAGTARVDDLVDRVARVTSDAGLFESSPRDIASRLEPIARIESAQKSEYLWQFTGSDTERGVAWVLAEFQPESQSEEWTFLRVQIALASEGSPMDAVRSKLITALDGRAASPHRALGEGLTIWKLGEYRQVSVETGEIENPALGTRAVVTLVEAALLQGEAE